MNEQEPIKIVIPEEEDETPMKAEQPDSSGKAAAAEATRKVAGIAKEAAQRAAQSETGRKAAGKVKELSDRGVRYVGTRMADTAEEQARQTVDAVQQRIRETDWEQEAKVGLAAGLRWLSGQLDDLSDRFTADSEEKSPADLDQPGDTDSK